MSIATATAATRTSSAPWPAASTVPLLRAREAHVWFVDLDARAWPVARFEASLSQLERRRAASAARPQHRRHLIVTRGLLRSLLAGYLGSSPDEVSLWSGPTGKPGLAAVARDPSLRFNCSRSGGRALIAVARCRRVGVDLEVVRDVPEAHRIAQRWFTPGERSALAAAAPDRATEVFLRTWTRLEAAVKASGVGLAEGLTRSELSVPLTAARDAAAWGRDPAASAAWSIRTLCPVAGYAAALAVEGAVQRLVCRQLVWEAPRAP